MPIGLCADDGGDADIEMGRCMSLLGIRPGESRDRKGRTRFYPYSAEVLNKMRVNTGYFSFSRDICWSVVNGFSICGTFLYIITMVIIIIMFVRACLHLW